MPLHAGAGLGEQLTTVGGHPAILSQVRVVPATTSGETDLPPGSVNRPVLVELAPDTVAFSYSMGDDLPDVGC